jgi:hypothetical protein
MRIVFQMYSSLLVQDQYEWHFDSFEQSPRSRFPMDEEVSLVRLIPHRGRGQGENLSKILSFYRFGSTAISVIIMLYKQLRQVFDEVEDDSRNGHVVS